MPLAILIGMTIVGGTGEAFDSHSGSELLLETGDRLLLESGDALLLE